MLDNLSLADRYCTLSERLKEIEAQVKALREQIISTGLERVTGDYADVVVALSERATFDAKNAQKYLTPDQVVECTRQTVVTTLRVKAKAGA
jgi:predicted transcriptional regulator YheO